MDKDCLVLWGGVDIDSSLYGEERGSYTQSPDKARDAFEIKAAKEAIKHGVPIIGVCRGAQLLCVLNGGKLHQHTIPHKHCHSILAGNVEFKSVSAGHHQIMRPSGNYKTIAVNPTAVMIFNEQKKEYYSKTDTPEIVWWPETKCLAIQPHPEWEPKGSEFVKWLNQLIKDLGIDYEF